MKTLFPALWLGLILLGAGCSRTAAPAGAEVGLHQNVPPHGGTPVALGDDYCLEVVRDADTGILSAYVLDDEMEEFIRVRDRSLAIDARVGGADRPLVLAAVANSATGETVGDTSLFQAQADWLKTDGSFAGTLRGITIRGTSFSDVPFSFPAPGGDAPVSR